MTAELDPHFFRHEAGKMTAALARVFGWHNLAHIEDIVQDTLLAAVEAWRIHGLPPEPGAWLMLAAKRRAVDAIRKKNVRERFAPEIDALLRTGWTQVHTIAEQFEPHALGDAELSAIFACAAPALASEVQLALILKILCGFSSAEIAHAFMEAPGTVDKRITRGKQALADVPTQLSAQDLSGRLPVVQQALYLLFSEGYHSSHPEETVRDDLCFEALRLAKLLCSQAVTATPDSFALCALMCLQAARLPARMQGGAYVPLEQQDRTRFDRALIAVGQSLLDRSAGSERPGPFHLEAAIAEQHCTAPSFAETDWSVIVRCYDALCAADSSPVLALNRAIALGQLGDTGAALTTLAAIEAGGALGAYPFLFAAQAKLFEQGGALGAAVAKLEQALAAARTHAERAYFRAWLERVRN